MIALIVICVVGWAVALLSICQWVMADFNLAEAEAELDAIQRTRSEAVARGNRTRAANRRAKQDQTTEKLRAEVTA